MLVTTLHYAVLDYIHKEQNVSSDKEWVVFRSSDLKKALGRMADRLVANNLLSPDGVMIRITRSSSESFVVMAEITQGSKAPDLSDFRNQMTKKWSGSDVRWKKKSDQDYMKDM